MDKATILVIDDTPANIDLLVGLLQTQYRVLAAPNGTLGLKIAQSPKAPDLLLVDIVMPDMDGFAVCEALRAHPQSESLPVILISGTLGEEERRRGEALGVCDFLERPIDPSQLLAAVEKALTS